MKIQIFGAGGFAKEVYSIIKNSQHDVLHFIDVEENGDIYGLPVISEKNMRGDIPSVVAVGDPRLRENIVKNIRDRYPNMRFPVIIDKNARILNRTSISIGDGSIICSGAIITCDIKIGRFCQFNLNTTIGHDTIIDDFCTTAPSVNLSGHTNVGKRVYFGTGSATKEYMSLCNDVTIGMGSMVVKSICHSGTYIGIPAKKL